MQQVILCNIPASNCQETGNRKSGIYIRLTEGSTSNYILSPLFQFASKEKWFESEAEPYTNPGG